MIVPDVAVEALDELSATEDEDVEAVNGCGVLHPAQVVVEWIS